MLKQVPQTDAIKALIAKAYGDQAIDTSTLAVFETIAANTKPLKRDHGLYQGARLGIDHLAAMHANLLGGEHIPLQLMHQGGIPVGKVFATTVYPMAGGHTALNAMFYLPKSSTELVGKIDAGIINEVSIGTMPKSLLCSECGFDYLSDAATFDNIYDCACDKGHVIGKNGVHLSVHGLAKWSELSLVDRGAVQGATILPRPRQSSPERLALRGFDDSLLMLRASATPQEQPPMSVDIEKYVALAASDIVMKQEALASKAILVAAEASVADLTVKLAAAEAEVISLKASDGVKAVIDLALADKFISERLTAAFAMTGKAGQALPETVSARVDALLAAQAALALAIPVGGASAPAATVPAIKAAANTDYSAFKR